MLAAKFRKAKFEKKQDKKAKRSPEKKKEAKELQWLFANCLRWSAVKN